MELRVLSTSLGPVEVALSGSETGEVVLVLPGGHATAGTPLGSDVYAELGYRVLSFSRPGYGRTGVGALTAAEFVPALEEVCGQLHVTAAAATVGVSFGGLQAVQVALALPHLGPRLVLHSCAPSSLPFPDTTMERIGGRVAFGARTQRLTWRLVRALTSSERGLQLMMSSLSAAPTTSWWDTWSEADRAAARATFAAMDSGSGFVNDLRQGTARLSGQREAALRAVPCPTLVTASRADGGVSFDHAEDFVGTIPRARLIETGAPSHFYWLGGGRPVVAAAVRDFLTS